jgi:hypothetical protein
MMAALRPAHRALLYGLLFGASVCAASPSGAGGVVSPAQTVTVDMLLDAQHGRAAEAWLQPVDWGRFCDWHARHPLCRRVNESGLACGQQPDDPLCAEADDRFCRQRPDHPLCGDDRFCEKRPDHPLCDDGPPPSPS